VVRRGCEKSNFRRRRKPIRERESKGETVESRFVTIEKPAITAVELRNRMAQIKVRFVSQIISVTRDKAGTVIDGDPEDWPWTS
jgi:predicted lipid-binding transport protein (Tim44 family)